MPNPENEVVIFRDTEHPQGWCLQTASIDQNAWHAKVLARAKRTLTHKAGAEHHYNVAPLRSHLLICVSRAGSDKGGESVIVWQSKSIWQIRFKSAKRPTHETAIIYAIMIEELSVYYVWLRLHITHDYSYQAEGWVDGAQFPKQFFHRNSS